MKLELLNSEGPILVGKSVKEKGTTKFILSFGSREKKPFELTKEEFIQFVSGEVGYKDLDGEMMIYPNFSQGMRPSHKKLEEFINS
jgi:hypothetical protein